MARVCIASHHGSLAGLRADPEFAPERAGAADAPPASALFELRLDQYSDLSAANMAGAVQALGPEHVVATFRRRDEGGGCADATDETRLFYLGQAASLRVAYVDIELATIRSQRRAWQDLRAFRRDDRPQFVVSFHDFAGSPPLEQLRALRREAEEAGADVVKLAVTAQTIFDTEPLLDLLRERDWRRPLLALAMSEAGFWTRVLGPLFPNPAPFTFARGTAAAGTAPGQPTWRELDRLYRFHELGPGTPVYGVIGRPIGHSLSPLMLNTALAARRLPGVYLPFLVVGDPARFVRGIAVKLGVRGLSVTIPHKEAVLAACAERDALVRQIGAANTLVRRGTEAAPAWHATNTDASAAAGSLEAALGGAGSLRGRAVAILGAGGAAKAVAFGVKARGAEVLIWNRTAERARDLAANVGARSVSKEELLQADPQVAAVVNTTPVGMYPRVDESPLEEGELPGGSLIFDTVYNPMRTKLLQMAEARGLKTLPGLEMFVGQGAAQFELFTGCPAPREEMAAVVRAELVRRASV